MSSVAADDPVGMFLGDLRLRIDRVEEGVDQLPHARLPQILAGGAEIGAVPIAGPIPPAPVAMVDVAADVAHQIGHAEDLAEGARQVRFAAGPTHARLRPAGPLHPVAEHADRRKPRLAGVIPEIAVLPIEHFVAGLVQIVAEQADERLRRGDRLAGRQRLLVAGDLQLDRDGPVGVSLERRGPVAEVVPADDHAVVRVFGQQGIPGGVACDAHAEAIAAAAAGLIARVADRGGHAHAARLRRRPDASRVLVHVGMLVAGARQTACRWRCPSACATAWAGVIDQIDVLAALEVLIPPAVRALLVAELLRGRVGFAVVVVDRRVEGGRVEADVAVHVDQERQLVAGGHIHAEIDRHGDRGIGHVSPAAGGPNLLAVEQNLGLDPIARKRRARRETARRNRTCAASTAELFGLQHPRAGRVLAAGHPMEIESPRRRPAARSR